MPPPLPAIVFETLDLMVRLEEMLAEFYRQCAAAWPADQEFWQQIERQEIAHADQVRQMTQLVKNRPEAFTQNRPFNPTGITLFLTRVQALTNQVETRSIVKKSALIAARDLEQSLLESRFFEFLSSEDPDFKALVRINQNETQAHLAIIRRKLDEPH